MPQRAPPVVGLSQQLFSLDSFIPYGCCKPNIWSAASCITYTFCDCFSRGQIETYAQNTIHVYESAGILSGRV